MERGLSGRARREWARMRRARRTGYARRRVFGKLRQQNFNCKALNLGTWSWIFDQGVHTGTPPCLAIDGLPRCKESYVVL